MIDYGMKFREDLGKWEANYPWIKDPSNLPKNNPAAISCLHSLERRLKENTEQAELYKNQIEDMLARGVCRKVSLQELENYKGPKYYISHHAVMKPSSKSTPCRIVFNSSANYKGHTLNDYFSKGPDLLNDLLEVLLRFREERVGVMGDITKMFHSVSIPLHDQMAHLFLWRNLETNREADTYAITAVNFGDRPSAAIALVALQKTAEREKEAYPEAANTIKKNSYMDDVVDSVATLQVAEKLTTEISEILRRGGFSIKEWVLSNNTHTEKDGNFVCSNGGTDQHVLGLGWNCEKDLLLIPRKGLQHIEPTSTTKRSILSKINGIYDPLGLIGPFTLRAKILMRTLWTQKKGLL